ncbi:2-C-methyl-D-erythritol 4-phosphate cytidylyltransferase [Aeromicrobium marinum DSM 15272]|uniref:2-C-methyl-D-erythritol 4-phosphate cytidylyltransferase n=1 Tax=Aeromicrobium marinum DSM 15272 TaxID=585531 RepID=E2SB63_9ACTN|nr:2-C-methyl-D-erythritol 4-phosphate cytidylyltransferase [Aeromicrobium marinum]EFQ83609.1 2-C-methyl-D-erythritol 4-phosphate cytidylyltransferase [Aeromicrobium marinum DSM 15272]
MTTVAVLLAGGTGTRLGAGRPKQFLPLGPHTVLEQCLEVFGGCSAVDEIVLVMEPDHLAEARRLVGGGAHPRVAAVVAGGATRAESTRQALAVIGEDVTHLLVHDVARPLVSRALVEACRTALREFGAVTPVVAPADTVVEASADGRTLERVLVRDRVRRVQTPQAFRAEVLRAAHAAAVREGDDTATDDCGVVARHLPDVTIGLVDGEETNLKITLPGDLELAERLLAGRSPVVP